MNTPNFIEWAKQLVDRHDVVLALEEAFHKGYQQGKDSGWVDDWEEATDDTYDLLDLSDLGIKRGVLDDPED